MQMDVETTFLFIVEVVGTIAAAISGIRMAASRHFDWFGAYSVGLVTAIGGGTLRDVLLGIPVFWMQTWWYLAVTGLSLLVMLEFEQWVLPSLWTSAYRSRWPLAIPSGWP